MCFRQADGSRLWRRQPSRPIGHPQLIGGDEVGQAIEKTTIVAEIGKKIGCQAYVAGQVVRCYVVWTPVGQDGQFQV